MSGHPLAQCTLDIKMPLEGQYGCLKILSQSLTSGFIDTSRNPGGNSMELEKLEESLSDYVSGSGSIEAVKRSIDRLQVSEVFDKLPGDMQDTVYQLDMADINEYQIKDYEEALAKIKSYIKGPT
jgi:hypothetical protein